MPQMPELKGSQLQTFELPAKVLLVSDDPSIFDVRERLAETYQWWGISSVPTAQKALRQLEQDDSIDAVVVGQRVSDTDSRLLLEALSKLFPSVARVAIAPSVNGAETLETIGIADKAIDLPVDIKQLELAIERSVVLRWRLNDPELESLLSEIDILPSPSIVVNELSVALREPQIDLSEIARIVESDPALTAKLLQMVNSAAFGLQQRMTKIDQIVAYLGTSVLSSMLTAVELLGAFAVHDADLLIDVETHRAHAMAVADIAQQLAQGRRQKYEAFIGGLLHDIGLLALMACSSARYRALRSEVRDARKNLEEAELDVLGTRHATIGAWLLGQWHLPMPICEVVARSHDANDMSSIDPDAAQAVYFAEQTTNKDSSADWWEPSEMPEEHYPWP